MVNLTMNGSTTSTIKREDISLFVQDTIRNYVDEIQQRFNISNGRNLYYSTDVISIAYNEELLIIILSMQLNYIMIIKISTTYPDKAIHGLEYFAIGVLLKHMDYIKPEDYSVGLD